jgi:hypothetical protein
MRPGEPNRQPLSVTGVVPTPTAWRIHYLDTTVPTVVIAARMADGPGWIEFYNEDDALVLKALAGAVRYVEALDDAQRVQLTESTEPSAQC